MTPGRVRVLVSNRPLAGSRNVTMDTEVHRMMKPPRNRTPVGLRSGRARLAGLALLALAPGFGCGREFFRQWADQDVTEAVFEKSRDPRWRLPTFTIDPPALSRFADPYDLDRPPAPPDDYATEALSPFPQLPHMRLIVPAEGTGYIDMLEQGQRYEPPPPGATSDVPPASDRPEGEELPALPGGVPGGTPPAATGPAPFAPNSNPNPALPSPNLPPGNSGPSLDGMSPNTTGSERLPSPPAGSTPPGGALPPQTQSPKRDTGVLTAAYQATDTQPTTPGALTAPAAGAASAPDLSVPPGDSSFQPGQVPAPGATPSPMDDQEPVRVDLGAPIIPGRNLTPDQRRQVQAATAGFAAILSPVMLEFNEATMSALPAESRPYVVGPAQALQLALINNRNYQYRLENLYAQSLTVTLNRFAFEPQFYAGLSPSTGVATGPQGVVGAIGGGFPTGGTGVNQFLYRTKEAQGGSASNLTLSTAAGFGKVFVFGGRLLGAFANTTVFNFNQKSTIQPTVQSSLPLTFVQPFLRGGGRAVTLEPLTLAERNLLYEVRAFARYRQQFIPYILASSSAGGATTAPDNSGGLGGGVGDPTIGFLNVLQQTQTIENTRRNVAAFQRALEIYQEYARGGASSGISQLQVDQIDQQLQQARLTLIINETNYRVALDQFKQQLGLPPDVPIILDRGLMKGFRDVFHEIDVWQAREDHDPEDLDGILAKLPKLENIVLDDRPLFDMSGPVPQQVFADPERQEEFLLVAERMALENRLDLMNFRATLYDTWRQLAVTANALLPIFNVSLTNQIQTPPTTSNPFAFVDQAKQFQLAINAELPLVRVNERNNFRSALINYQRGRRLLMNQEDTIKFTVRQEIRLLIQYAENYEITKKNLLLVLRQRDQSLQQIIAPPDASATGGASSASQATQTLNLIQSTSNIVTQQNSLIQFWVQYQSVRLALYRDLGIMPYDEWEAYYELFPAAAGNTAARNNRAGTGPAGGPPSDVIPTPNVGS